MRILGWSVLLFLATGCSGPRPTLETNPIAFIFSVPKKFQARLEPKTAYDGDKGLRLVFEYTGFPDGASLSWAGKDTALTHVGTVDGGFDLSDVAGAVPFDGAMKVAPPGTLKVSFAKGKHAFDLSVMPLSFASAIDGCMRSIARAPCRVKGEALTAGAVPKIAYLPPGGRSAIRIGAPATLRDVDWVAIGAPLDVESTRKCTMSKVDDLTSLHPLKTERTFDLKVAREEISIYDRRTGAKVHTKVLSARDVCPFNAKLTDAETSVTNPLTDTDRRVFFGQFRGEAPAVSAPPPSAAPAKPPKHRK